MTKRSFEKQRGEFLPGPQHPEDRPHERFFHEHLNVMSVYGGDKNPSDETGGFCGAELRSLASDRGNVRNVNIPLEKDMGYPMEEQDALFRFVPLLVVLLRCFWQLSIS